MVRDITNVIDTADSGDRGNITVTSRDENGREYAATAAYDGGWTSKTKAIEKATQASLNDLTFIFLLKIIIFLTGKYSK